MYLECTMILCWQKLLQNQSVRILIKKKQKKLGEKLEAPEMKPLAILCVVTNQIRTAKLAEGAAQDLARY